MEKAKGEFIYLYCITRSKPPHTDFEGVDVKISPIYFQGIYGIVSRVSPAEFSEENLKKNLADIAWVEKNVRQHEKVIEEIMRNQTVLPFKFGTVFETEKNAEKLLKENNREFKSILAELDDKEEWGLKIYSNMEHFKDMLCEENERIKEKNKEIASANKGKAYFLKKKKSDFIKDIINEKISEYTKDCFERLKKTTVATKINKILPKEVTEKKEEMVLNAAFLINKKCIKEFDNILAYLKTKYSNKGLILDCAGPWPPYNFCNLLEKRKTQNE